MKKGIILSLLTTICVTFLLMAFPVSAAETSGTCGEKMTWSFDTSSGTLTVSGEGEMDAGEFPGWMDYRGKIKYVIIEAGVTSISRGAFYGCTNLNTVTLPDTLRVIGANSFSGCQNLKNPSFSDNRSHNAGRRIGAADLFQLW